ncbi:transglycosylase SLT domain-containing protein [Nocardia sp. NPDC048505]|uniref:transglycosylase SLT domain-containing protein n=1 Tax=unclassified Nocardia TaxID=2637762 RepID=UPI0033DA0E93
MKFPTLRRPNLREDIGFALAAAGIAAVTASSAVAMADTGAPAPAAMAAEAKTAHTAAAVSPKAGGDYPDNLDGWIREALEVLKANKIPATYEGIHKNIIRESAGKRDAINQWDSNAAMGIPSKGLLQVIDPTFQAYHVPGTPNDVWDPVANIAAACNYAAHRYGSMDNVNSAY